jgi:hypothetical protein
MSNIISFYKELLKRGKFIRNFKVVDEDDLDFLLEYSEYIQMDMPEIVECPQKK